MSRRVYFYCRDNETAYQDDVVVLADGLRQLGVEVHGNCNYWRQSPGPSHWLIRHDPAVTPDDCDVVVVAGAWVRWIDSEFRVTESPLPDGLFKPGRRYRTAYLDLEDGYETPSWRPEFAAFDAVFRAKYNERCHHPANHHPWVLGINTRMLVSTNRAPPFSERRREVLVNFGASHPYVHSARALAGPPFVAAAKGNFTVNDRRDDLTVAPHDPYDWLMWEQTQHRHSRAYYERLKGAQAIVAFCGELIPPAPFHPRYLVGGRRARISRWCYDRLAKFDSRPPRLIQWDSWRFWEGLAAGCLVFNLDLPHYGVLLPVMPVPFVHYVPVRVGHAAEAFKRLAVDPSLGERIAAEGRAWAMQHYTPRPLAERFLATLDAKPGAAAASGGRNS